MAGTRRPTSRWWMGRGCLLAAVRGETTSHQQVGGDAGMQRLSALVAKAYATAGVRDAERADVGVYCLAGADTPSDVRELTGATRRGRFRADRPAPKRYVRGPAGRHRPGLGRGRDLRAGRQRGRGGARWPNRPTRCAGQYLGGLGRGDRRRVAGACGGRSGARWPGADGRSWSGPCPGISGSPRHGR